MIADPYRFTEQEYKNIPRETFNFIASRVLTKKACKILPQRILQPFFRDLCCGLMSEICRTEMSPLHIPTKLALKSAIQVVHPDFENEPYLTDWLWKNKHILRVKAPHPKELKFTYRNGQRKKEGENLHWEVMQTFGQVIV